jgi:transcriptional regulator with XRE-family HTH domain
MGTSGEMPVGGGELAASIRSYRHSRGLTQTELARRLNVTQQTVARWEQGFPPRSDLVFRIEAEIGNDQESDNSAEIFRLHQHDAERSVVQDDGSPDLLEPFLTGCVRIIERGERLSDDLMTFVLEELKARGKAGPA